MAIYYVETSAILKRYRTERGSDVVSSLYEDRIPGDRLVTSHFSCIEVEAVAARAWRGRLLNDAAYATLLGSFSYDLANHIELLPLTGEVLNDSALTARLYWLRAPDAIHLAAAHDVQDKANDEADEQLGDVSVIFVTSDKELARARRPRIRVLNPEAEDAMTLLRKLR